MTLYERIASSLIGTPVQGMAEGLRGLAELPKRLKHPEMKEVYLEGGRAKEVIERLVTPGVNCIDIGCHLGSVLERFVRKSPAGRHIAVEPLPYKAGWLRKKFPGVEVHECALGEEETTVEFFHDPKHSGFSGLKSHGDGEKRALQVRCRRLDDVEPADRKIAFIKLDVEGAEYYVFRGARRVLAESRPVVLFECTGSGLEAFDLEARRVFDLLNDELGYRIYLIKDWLAGAGPLDLAAFEAAMKYPFQGFNFIAAPAPSA